MEISLTYKPFVIFELRGSMYSFSPEEKVRTNSIVRLRNQEDALVASSEKQTKTAMEQPASL